jgi:hypothetical protein
MPYKDENKQKEANRAAKKRWKERKADMAVREALGIPLEGIPGKGIPPVTRIPETFVDATGQSHEIDFAGRRQVYELLKSWDEEQADTYQHRLGHLARQYSHINGFLWKDKNNKYHLTEQGKTYLGYQ